MDDFIEYIKELISNFSYIFFNINLVKNYGKKSNLDNLSVKIKKYQLCELFSTQINFDNYILLENFENENISKHNLLQSLNVLMRKIFNDFSVKLEIEEKNLKNYIKIDDISVLIFDNNVIRKNYILVIIIYKQIMKIISKKIIFEEDKDLIFNLVIFQFGLLLFFLKTKIKLKENEEIKLIKKIKPLDFEIASMLLFFNLINISEIIYMDILKSEKKFKKYFSNGLNEYRKYLKDCDNVFTENIETICFKCFNKIKFPNILNKINITCPKCNNKIEWHHGKIDKSTCWIKNLEKYF